MPAAAHCRGVRQRTVDIMRLRTLSLSPASWGVISMGGLTTSCRAQHQNTIGVWTIRARMMMWMVGGMSVNQQPCHTQAPKKGGGGRTGDPRPFPRPFPLPDTSKAGHARPGSAASCGRTGSHRSQRRHHHRPPAGGATSWSAPSCTRTPIRGRCNLDGMGPYRIWDSRFMGAGVAAPR